MEPAQILLRGRLFLLFWCGLRGLSVSAKIVEPAQVIACSRRFHFILWSLCKGIQPAEIVFRPRSLPGRLVGWRQSAQVVKPAQVILRSGGRSTKGIQPVKIV